MPAHSHGHCAIRFLTEAEDGRFFVTLFLKSHIRNYFTYLLYCWKASAFLYEFWTVLSTSSAKKPILVFMQASPNMQPGACVNYLECQIYLPMERMSCLEVRFTGKPTLLYEHSIYYKWHCHYVHSRSKVLIHSVGTCLPPRSSTIEKAGFSGNPSYL